MTANYKHWRGKRRSGFILLELNVLFMIIVLVSGVYCNAAQAVLRHCEKLLSDLEIMQAARYTESILRRELSYTTTQAKLGKDFNGRDQIICQKTPANVRSYWYVSGMLLYRKTVRQMATGTNPFSNPEVRIVGFRTLPLGKKKLGILMVLRDPDTGLERKVPLNLFLSNGSVIQ